MKPLTWPILRCQSKTAIWLMSTALDWCRSLVTRRSKPFRACRCHTFPVNHVKTTTRTVMSWKTCCAQATRMEEGTPVAVIRVVHWLRKLTIQMLFSVLSHGETDAAKLKSQVFTHRSGITMTGFERLFATTRTLTAQPDYARTNRHYPQPHLRNRCLHLP
jgi:hypothetical protein